MGQSILLRDFYLQDMDRGKYIPMFPPSTPDNVDSTLAVTVHFGLRLREDHSSSPGPVCFPLGLLHEVIINPMPDAKGVAPTTLLKECHEKPEMELTSLRG